MALPASHITVTQPPDGPPSRGLLLPCPVCMQENASVTLALADCHSLHCQECDAVYTVDDVRQIVLRWQPVLHWIDSAPTREQ